MGGFQWKLDAFSCSLWKKSCRNELYKIWNPTTSCGWIDCYLYTQFSIDLAIAMNGGSSAYLRLNDLSSSYHWPIANMTSRYDTSKHCLHIARKTWMSPRIHLGLLWLSWLSRWRAPLRQWLPRSSLCHVRVSRLGRRSALLWTSRARWVDTRRSSRSLWLQLLRRVASVLGLQGRRLLSLSLARIGRIPPWLHGSSTVRTFRWLLLLWRRSALAGRRLLLARCISWWITWRLLRVAWRTLRLGTMSTRERVTLGGTLVVVASFKHTSDHRLGAIPEA